MRRAVLDSPAKSHSAMGAIIGTGLSLIGFILLGITGSPLFIIWLIIAGAVMIYYLCCLLGDDAAFDTPAAEASPAAKDEPAPPPSTPAA